MITVLCPAKVNLFLNIIGKDQYFHKMHMINQSISLYDKLTISKIEDGIKLTCNDSSIPVDKTNSVYKAVIEFIKYTKVECNVKIEIEKDIPTMSGLGGESTDAAGTIIGLNKLFNTNLTETELLYLGFKIGCDVPFCIKGGTQEVLGYGEILKPYIVSNNYFLVVTPTIGFSTKNMFKYYDDLNEFKELPITLGHNDFHKVINKEIREIIDEVSATLANYSLLTGSGSSIIGLYDNVCSRDIACEILTENLKGKVKIKKAQSTTGIKIK